jgi:tetratricopeptide (TPR) repeat protein
MNINKAIESAFENHKAGKLERAQYIYKKILGKYPKHFDALHMLGVTCFQLGKLDSAVMYIKKALQISPTNALAYYNLANVFQAKRQHDEAITYYQKAVELNPTNAYAYYNLGNIFIEEGQRDKAVQCYQKAIDLDPKYVDAYYNLGNTFKEEGQHDKAVQCYQKAIDLDPKYVDAYCNLGNTFKEEGQHDKAVQCYQKAIDFNPNSADAYYNLGNILKDKGHLDEAISYYQKAVEIRPNFVNAHFNMSLTNLLSYNFKQGWAGYEWRWKLEGKIQHNFSQPLWDGSDIRGLTILLHAEQGFGDTIQFIRYVPLIAQQGAEVIIWCQEALASLLQNVKGIKQVFARGEQIPQFDVHCPLASLPFVFDTVLESIPAIIPYITVDSLLVRQWFNKIQRDNSKLKIGIAWSGSKTHIRDRYRSCALETFSPLTQLDNIALYSLQKGEAIKQAMNPPEDMKLIDYTEEISDFSDTAAFIENLDLVISVDTVVAHLAGALGKPVWTLLPFAPDWRWMLNREDSPWYPTMRLFRQPVPGDWNSVMKKVSEELQKLVSSKA